MRRGVENRRVRPVEPAERVLYTQSYLQHAVDITRVPEIFQAGPCLLPFPLGWRLFVFGHLFRRLGPQARLPVPCVIFGNQPAQARRVQRETLAGRLLLRLLLVCCGAPVVSICPIRSHHRHTPSRCRLPLVTCAIQNDHRSFLLVLRTRLISSRATIRATYVNG